MHIVVSWDIHAENPEWGKLNASLKECIKGYSWVKPLTTLFIVKISTADDRKLIRKRLVAVCEKNKKKINVIISPIMDGGSYGGWLPSAMWDKIKSRTEEDDLYE